MNERIEELAEQAGFSKMGIWNIIGIQEYHEKFAALIVRECADICTARKLTPAAFVASELREYFGVEQ